MISMQIRNRLEFRILSFGDQKLKKFQLKKNSFLSKIAIFIPNPPWRTFKLQEKPSALKSNIKFLHFFLFFWVTLPSWIRIQPTSNADTIWIRTTGNKYIDQYLTRTFWLRPLSPTSWLVILWLSVPTVVSFTSLKVNNNCCNSLD